MGFTPLEVFQTDEVIEYTIKAKIAHKKGWFPAQSAWEKDREIEGLFLQIPLKGIIYLENGYGAYIIEAYYRDGSTIDGAPPSLVRSTFAGMEVEEDYKAGEITERWKGTLVCEIPITIKEKK